MPPPRPEFRRIFARILAGLAFLAIFGFVTALGLGVKATADAALNLQATVLTTELVVRTGEFGGLGDSLRAVQASSAALENRTDSWQWRVLSIIPGMAPTTHAIESVGGAALTMSAAALPLADALGDALATSTGSTELLQRLPELLPMLKQVSLGARQAGLALAPATDQAARFGISEKAVAFQNALDTLATSTEAISEHAPELEGLLGFNGKRRYLVMLQNPAEARGSGGLFSAFMVLELNDDSPTILEANSRKVLDELRIPTKGILEKNDTVLWGKAQSKWASFNVSADFPHVARLAQAGMAARGTPVDGVIAIDPSAVGAVLAGTGPVEHQNVTIDEATASDFFTKGIYTRFPSFSDVEAKDELTLGLLYATMDSALQRPLDLAGLARTIPPAVTDGHVKIWSASTSESAWLDQLGASGSLESADPETIAIAFNNAVGGKLDSYVNSRATLAPGPCLDPAFHLNGYRLNTLDLTVTNNAPLDLPDYVDFRLDDGPRTPGSTRTLIHVYGPSGAVDMKAALDGTPINLITDTEAGRPVWASEMELPRGAAKTLTITFAELPRPRPESAIMANGANPLMVTNAGGKISSLTCPDVPQ